MDRPTSCRFEDALFNVSWLEVRYSGDMIGDTKTANMIGFRDLDSAKAWFDQLPASAFPVLGSGARPKE